MEQGPELHSPVQHIESAVKKTSILVLLCAVSTVHASNSLLLNIATNENSRTLFLAKKDEALKMVLL
jgi:hypothetical protein